TPAGGELADLRWTTVVLGLAAAMVTVVPGVALLAHLRASSAGDAVALAVMGGMASALVGWMAHARGWGRVPAAILTAAVAPYAGGAAMLAVDGVLRHAMTDHRGDWEHNLYSPEYESALFLAAIAVTAAASTL